ncbi:uncharacterized protein LOC127748746, partial [Frankliniella occidentalis]|uniref:Uncharacterized protein LOC127748746 n=1 Tax=Frankliniella occidentalis TaxID=133901 RepID=A0A9C6WVB2_FRAOC
MGEQGKLLRSERGGYILSYNGYLYNKHGENKDGSRTYWICRKKPACKKRAITSSPQENSDTVDIFKFVDHPSHLPAPEEAEAVGAYNQLKRKAAEHPNAPPAQILREGMPEIPQGALFHLPERRSMKRTFNRLRNAAANLPVNPKSLEDVGEIPADYTITRGRKQFLIFDSYFDEDDEDDEDEDVEERDRRRRQNRILIFASKDHLRKLAASSVWHLDGTFDTPPEIFAQILTMHGEYHNETLPLVYALLPNKTQDTYHRAIDAVIDACERYRLRRPAPRTVITDMEKGLMNAVQALFPATELRLCLFHLRQAAFRKIQSLGLQPAYQDDNNDTVRTSFREVVGLAFVPTEDVEEAFNEAKAAAPRSMRDFVKYFEETYVLGKRARNRRQRRPPRYLPALWNQHQAARDNEPRTNNQTEGWHNRFQLVVGKSHPTLYKIIDEFKKEEADTRVMLNEIDAGRSIKPPQRLKYKRINE